jgi:hypothetical protein
MPGQFYIFSLYQHPQNARYYLLRTLQPAYSGASQTDENRSLEMESAQRNGLLYAIDPEIRLDEWLFVGEQQGFPIGDVLYENNGGFDVPLWYVHTEYGYPWIIIGTAESEADFLRELEEDEDLQALRPIGNAISLNARLVWGLLNLD